MGDVSTQLDEITRKRKEISEQVTKLVEERKAKGVVKVAGRYIPAMKSPEELRLDRQLKDLNEQEKSIKMQEGKRVIAQEKREERKETVEEIRQLKRYAETAPEKTISEAEKKGKLIEEYETARRQAERKGFLRPEPEYKEKEVRQPVYAKREPQPTYPLPEGEFLPETKEFLAKQKQKFQQELFRKQEAHKAQQIMDVPIIQFVKQQKKRYETGLELQTIGKTREELITTGVIRKTTKKDIALAPYKYAYTEQALGISKEPVKPISIIGAASKETWDSEEILMGGRGGGVISITQEAKAQLDKPFKYPTGILKSGVGWAFEKKEAPTVITKVHQKIQKVGKEWTKISEIAPSTRISPLAPSLKTSAKGMAIAIAGSAEATGFVKTGFEYPTLTTISVGAFMAGGATVKLVAGKTVAKMATTGAVLGLHGASWVVSPPKTKFEAYKRAWDVPILIGVVSAIKQTPVAAKKAKGLLYKDIEIRRLAKVDIVKNIKVGREISKSISIRSFESAPYKTRVLGVAGKGLRKIGVPIKGKMTMPKPQKTIYADFQQVVTQYPKEGGTWITTMKGKGKFVRQPAGEYKLFPTKQPRIIGTKFTGIGVTGKPAKLPAPISYWEKPAISVKGYTYTQVGEPIFIPKTIITPKGKVPISFKKLERGIKGEYDVLKQTISLKKGLPSKDISKVLSHETGHLLQLTAKQDSVPAMLFRKKGTKVMMSSKFLKEHSALAKKGLTRPLPKGASKAFQKGVSVKESSYYDTELWADQYSTYMRSPKIFKKIAPSLTKNMEQMIKTHKIPPSMIQGRYIEKPIKIITVSSYTRPGKFKIYPASKTITTTTETLGRDRGLVVKSFEKMLREKPRLIETQRIEAVPTKRPPKPKVTDFFKKAIAKQGAIKLQEPDKVPEIRKLALSMVKDKQPKLPEGHRLVEWKKKGLFGTRTVKSIINTKMSNLEQLALSRVRQQSLKIEAREVGQQLLFMEKPKLIQKPILLTKTKPITTVKIIKAKPLKSGLFYAPKFKESEVSTEYSALDTYLRKPSSDFESPIEKAFKKPFEKLTGQLEKPPKASEFSKFTERMKPSVIGRVDELLGIKLKPKEKVKLKPKQVSKSKPKQIIRVKSKAIQLVKQKQIVGVKQAVKQKQRQALKQKLKQKFKYAPPSRPKLIYEPPYVPPPGIPFGLPLFKLHTIRPPPLFFPKPKRKRKYRPTVFSVATGFAAKELPMGTLSGLGLRPLRL